MNYSFYEYAFEVGKGEAEQPEMGLQRPLETGAGGALAHQFEGPNFI